MNEHPIRKPITKVGRSGPIKVPGFVVKADHFYRYRGPESPKSFGEGDQLVYRVFQPNQAVDANSPVAWVTGRYFTRGPEDAYHKHMVEVVVSDVREDLGYRKRVYEGPSFGYPSKAEAVSELRYVMRVAMDWAAYQLARPGWAEANWVGSKEKVAKPKEGGRVRLEAYTEAGDELSRQVFSVSRATYEKILELIKSEEEPT